MTQRTVLILSFTLFIAALFWGGYTLLVYLGMPIHQLVYLNSEQVGILDQSCGSSLSTGTLLCRGTSVLWWFLSAVLQTGSPFLPYVVLSLLAYGALLLWIGYKTGHFKQTFFLRPVLFIGFFVLSVWLIATTLSVTTLYNANAPAAQRVQNVAGDTILPPFTRFYEPLASVYGVANDQAIRELQANYESLLARGCLSPIKNAAGQELQTSGGARVYNLSFLCMQGSIFSRVGLQILMVLLLLVNFLVLGRAILSSILRLRPVHPLFFFCLSFGTGAFALVVILWTIAVLGVLTGWVAATIFFSIPIVLFPWTRLWFKDAFTRSVSVDVSWKNITMLLGWLLISYLALNFLNVVRPFPIGWDDLGSYLNRPRLLASYGYFIPSMSQFQWEYLTSLGFLIFGYDSPIGSTIAMQINWAAGLLAVLSAYAFGRLFLGKNRGFLTAILYYFLPMTGHFSFADMKIDNASFFTSALAILAVFIVCFKSSHDDEDAVATHDWRLLLVAGILIGFSFSIKPTAVLAMLLCFSVVGAMHFGAFGFSALAVAGFGILAKFGTLNIGDIAGRVGLSSSMSMTTFTVTLSIIALALFAEAVRRKRSALLPFARSIGFFILGASIAILPWGIHNMVNNNSYSIGSMLSAADNTAPQVFYQQESVVATWNVPSTVPTRALTPDLAIDLQHTACKTSARFEELDRYWGFNKSFSHYLTLPWRQVMNVDAFGYYVTLMPALLLVPLLLLLPFFWRPEGRWLRFLFGGSMIFLIQWAFVANGIAWYGIGMFLGFSVMLEAFVARAPDRSNRWLFSILLLFSILVCLVNRFWQLDTQKNIFEYPLGKVSASALREVTIPEYDDIRQSVVFRHETMPETPYTFRIGTFISYFIPKNREIFPLADHQMSFFHCVNQERDHALTLKRLKALGFNSIIFDTNTHTIEKDPNGSLHKKVEAFLAFVNDPAIALQIVVNNPANGIAYILLP